MRSKLSFKSSSFFITIGAAGAVLAGESGYSQSVLIGSWAGGQESVSSTGFVELGYSFTVGNAGLEVTELGAWDSGGAAGMPEAVPVAIWTADQQLVAASTVPAGTAGRLQSGFYYTPITPVELDPNTTYTITEYLSILGFDGATELASSVSPSPFIVLGSPFGITTNDCSGVAGFHAEGFFGPSAGFSALPVITPEPSSIALGTLGGLGALVLFRRRK